MLCSIHEAQSSVEHFVGAKACQSCHEQQYQDWQGSHHAKSMMHADSRSVLGNFNNEKLIEQGEVNRFYKKTSQYWVNIKGPTGEFKDYQIKYTFGVEPLQQYMVEFSDGRIQLIPFAWDSRPKALGGQRWFNLYPQMTTTDQEFFWTNIGQNWNYMCADCHSTNVRKNHDLNTNTYNTTFSEINVACESCHGPASKHLQWSKNNTIANFGFNRDLSSSVKAWRSLAQANTLSPEKVKHSQQVTMCAQCHSRRTQISNKDHVNTNAFGERYMLDLISSENYYADGQVYNENFVYGSFLQSKMHQNGVVCSDCHNPHSAKLKLPVETLCLQCHSADKYGDKKHHNHQTESSGAQCVNCHMPETTYMNIDARRDHGFHIPRPDLAKKLGTPDTCLSCHQNKDSAWSNQQVNNWYPQSTIKEANAFATTFSASNVVLNEQQLTRVSGELSRISQTINYAPIIRASALARMANTSNNNIMIAIARAVKNPNENIRLGAIAGAQSMANAQKWRLLSPLLTDEVLLIRASSAFALVSLWNNLTKEQQALLSPALDEYITIQHFNSDRGFSHANLAIVNIYQGQYQQAIAAFNQGMLIEPYFVQSYIHLSQLYSQLAQNNNAIATLRLGIKANPSNAELLHQLGLAYIRAKDQLQAQKYLAKATQLAPENSHYFYVYGLSLEHSAPKKAYSALLHAFQLSNNPQYLYALCDIQLKNNAAEAKSCLMELSDVVPNNVVEQLKARY